MLRKCTCCFELTSPIMPCPVCGDKVCGICYEIYHKHNDPGLEQKEQAMRFNTGKTRMELLPFWLLKDLAEHYAAGAKKYEDWNWIKGFNDNVCSGALLRHFESWQSGEDIDVGTEEDPGTNTHHMLAIAWNALAIYHNYKFKLSEETRPKLPNAK